MKTKTTFLILALFLFIIPNLILGQKQEDKYLWLEEVESEKSIDWVKAQNKKTIDVLKGEPEFQDIYDKTLKIYNSKDRIAYPSIQGEYIYNFWKDENHKRGIWRRASLKEYKNDNTKWETVLDLDALSNKEGEKWAYKGATFLYPDYDRCILKLSRGGSDAVEMREYDLIKKDFVKDGFFVPQSKGSVSWIDKNTIILNSNFGEGTMTTSGYPRISKIWKRGTLMSEGKVLFEGNEKDLGIWGSSIDTPERQYIIVYQAITFYTSNVYILEGEKLVKLDIPEDASMQGVFKNQMLVELKSDWNVAGNKYRQGALLSIDYNKFLKGDRSFNLIYQPDERSSLVSVSSTKNFLLLNRSTNVKSELYKYHLNNNKWISEKVKAPDFGTINISSTDDLSDQYFFSFQNFLIPSSLYYVADKSEKINKLKSLPEYFDSSKFEVKQYEVTSKDGTQIPYFLVYPKNIKFDGNNPTLLNAYGGFEVSRLPFYSATFGSSWLEKGGVFVLANIRGGGEFGPKWHQAGLKENRQVVFDDFIAVSEDLIKKKITSPDHLGIMGGSNGGLLVGVAFTQRPDLYNAVVCAVPLLDMKRYNKLLAGASWMGEYGNPDKPEEWAYIKKYSPYQNVFEAKDYPKVFFTTTTRDDRVHPGHARKMAAKMDDQDHDFFYFENTEGGHGSGVTNEQRAMSSSLQFSYLLKMLKSSEVKN
ncbi:MAG: S9 family peptidase [Flavobacteriaceae bacterium]|nr:S9 family peptidase [Flavobacteriaceae bacterium]